MRARRRKIQLPYPNTHETIWEYKESFLSRQIDFFSFIGAACPVCGKQDCYREITPYWRYAIDLFPEFKKERVPVARFLCDKRERTFSILPSQLIPYFQYTVNAVLGTLLLVLHYRQMGQKGLHGASVAVDPDTLLTPWLIACWLGAVVLGFRRAHGVLRQWYNLADIRSSHGSAAWEEASGYFLCFGWHLQIRWGTSCRRFSHLLTDTAEAQGSSSSAPLLNIVSLPTHDLSAIGGMLQRLLIRLFLPKFPCWVSACPSSFAPTARKPRAGNQVLISLRTEHC